MTETNGVGVDLDVEAAVEAEEGDLARTMTVAKDEDAIEVVELHPTPPSSRSRGRRVPGRIATRQTEDGDLDTLGGSAKLPSLENDNAGKPPDKLTDIDIKVRTSKSNFSS